MRNDVKYTVKHCILLEKEREEVERTLQHPFKTDIMVNWMLQGEEKWTKIPDLVMKVMKFEEQEHIRRSEEEKRSGPCIQRKSLFPLEPNSTKTSADAKPDVHCS